MSRHSSDPRGAHDFSSPQVRVRGSNEFRHYSSQRLRLPNERPPLGPRLRRVLGGVLTLAVLGGIGVAVYFGVSWLLDDDESTTAEVVETQEAAQTETAVEPAGVEEESEQAQVSEVEDIEGEIEQETTTVEEAEAASVEDVESDQAEQPAAAAQPQAESEQPMAVSSIEPTVAVEQVTPAQIDGAEIVVERVTAEPIPSGIPRTLADGADYDPTEPATVFTARWPVGTTLRLTRLPGATLLTDEEQTEVVGTEALVVVRGSESSNTDLQLSPAAFDQIAFYGTERIIAVRVEVTAPPP